MPVIEKYKTAILENASSVKFTTDNVFYDESYPNLLKAGRLLKKQKEHHKCILTLTCGLLAWNQGTKHAENMSGLLSNKCTENKVAFCNLINLVREIETDSTDKIPKIEQAEKAVTLAQQALRMNSITMPSKLLHFLSPRYFVITDTNVDASLGGGSATFKGYIDLRKL